MRSRPSPRLLVALLAIPPLLACSVGSGGTSSSGTATTPPPVCATHATTTARAWVAGQQIAGSVGGGAVSTLSNFVSPLGLPSEADTGDLAWYPDNITWSPDAHHIAVDVYLPVPDSNASTYPYLIDTTTHAVTRINAPVNTDNEGLRNLAWADNNTLLILTGDTPGKSPVPSPAAVYSYNVATTALTTLPGIAHMATDGVVRCNTLFYMEVTPFTNIGVDSNGANEFRGSALLHRYNLTTHTEIGGPITFSDTFNADGSFGFYIVPGWDVSADGTKIAYQHMATHLSTAPHDYSVKSTFFAAGADGSGATQIFGGTNPVFTYSGVKLAISPNAANVAITSAFPSPDIATDSMTGGSLRYYSPDGYFYPAWLPDSSGFDASAESGSSRFVERYLLSTPLGGSGLAPGSLLVSSASDPASLP
ncbi:MAG TPA: hypothetical protein VID72_10415 [Ktedonobacterales bacterium]